MLKKSPRHRHGGNLGVTAVTSAQIHHERSAVARLGRYNHSCTMAKKKTTRTRATTPDAHVAEPDGSPAVVRATANEMQTLGGGRASDLPTFEQISEAAYHRYLQRGGQHGHDFDDWLDAERSLRSRN